MIVVRPEQAIHFEPRSVQHCGVPDRCCTTRSASGSRWCPARRQRTTGSGSGPQVAPLSRGHRRRQVRASGRADRPTRPDPRWRPAINLVDEGEQSCRASARKDVALATAWGDDPCQRGRLKLAGMVGQPVPGDRSRTRPEPGRRPTVSHGQLREVPATSTERFPTESSHNATNRRLMSSMAGW